MHPALRRLDVLFVDPCAYEALQPGDVVVFRAPDGRPPDSYVVHRVRRRTERGLVTQGDACAHPDIELVRPEQLLGRVRRVLRAGRVRPVWGGRAARLYLRWVRLRRAAVALGAAPYRFLPRVVGRPGWWRPRVTRVRVQTQEGPLVKFVCGGRTVGEHRPEWGASWCRKPYDLVVGPPER